MTAEKYASEVEFIVRQVQQGTLELWAAWPRLQLLTLAYEYEGQ